MMPQKSKRPVKLPKLDRALAYFSLALLFDDSGAGSDDSCRKAYSHVGEAISKFRVLSWAVTPASGNPCRV